MTLMTENLHNHILDENCEFFPHGIAQAMCQSSMSHNDTGGCYNSHIHCLIHPRFYMHNQSKLEKTYMYIFSYN